MNKLLERYDHLPKAIPEEQIPALLKGQEVTMQSIDLYLFTYIHVTVNEISVTFLQLLAKILSRDSSLLPAYFAADAVSVCTLLAIPYIALCLYYRYSVTTRTMASPVDHTGSYCQLLLLCKRA